MKWVNISPGHHKLVEDDDPRPEVKLKTRKGAPYTLFSPSWRKYEEGAHHQDSPNQGDSTDRFIAQRDHELKTNPKAKKWEESRKASWAKDKPAWRKERMKRGTI